MFTGIVGSAKINTIHSGATGWELIVDSGEVAVKVKLGDSVAIDGACLSVTKINDNLLHFFVSLESIDKTIIKNYKTGTAINIELPMQPTGYLGGHYVLGHVDANAIVSAIEKGENAWYLEIAVPSVFEKYVVYKGSIAINGVSLTINEVNGNHIELCIIPVTLTKTNIGSLLVGDAVNIEFDILAKYTEKLLIKRDVKHI